ELDRLAAVVRAHLPSAGAPAGRARRPLGRARPVQTAALLRLSPALPRLPALALSLRVCVDSAASVRPERSAGRPGRCSILAPHFARAEGSNATANAWRMASLKSFFDSLLPGSGRPLAVSLYAAASVALLSALAAVWAARRTTLQVSWILTSLVAVLVDPHLVDYDLT